MKNILFSLLFVFCCTITCAQKKSEVLEKLKETITEYFLPDFNDAIEFPEWRNPDNDKGLASASSVYIEPNHFFRNGKVCTSYADWMNQYCSQSLHGRIIEHSLALNETLQKVSGNNDLYRVEATLLRRWANEEGPAIPAEKINITFLWRGTGNLVHIMQLDGNIRPIQLPKPVVETPVPQQTEVAVNVISDNLAFETDGNYISDSSLVVYFFEELLSVSVKEKKMIGFGTVVFFLLVLMAAVLDTNEKWAYWLKISNWWEPLGITCLYTFFIVIFFIGICVGVPLAFDMYKGKHKPHRIRLEYLEAYDSYRLAVPHKAVAVAKDGKWGLVNFAGQVTCPLQLDTIGDFQQDVAIVQADGLYAFLHADGTNKFEWMNHITPFREGRSIVELKEKVEKGRNVYSYYLFDLNAEIGRRYTQLPYELIFFWNSSEVVDRYKVRKDGKYSIIDGQGRVIVPLEYDDIIMWNYHEGLIRVRKDGGGRTGREKLANSKYGYINLDGELVIPLQYRSAKDFSEGLAAVENDKGLVGYIDTQGNLAIPFRYIDGQPFKNGRAVVRANIHGGPYGVIDTKGNWILKPEQHWESDINERLRALDNK